MAKGSFKIKLSANMKPYVGRVVRGGRVQKAFAAGPGASVGSCVGNQLRGKKGVYSGGQIKDIVRECARSSWPKGRSLMMFPEIGGRDIPR
jgi:hypothetical protein